MTYLDFLARFLLVPIIALALLNGWDRQRGKPLPAALQGYAPLKMLAILVVIALVYTTPWDNYLVATGVWWYNPSLVSGIVFGWVPLEEYLFFMLQPILVGLWLLWWARRLPSSPVNSAHGSRVRFAAVAISGCIWLASVALLLSGWQPATYLALEFVWALPPILIQLFFGADILARQWRLVLLTVVPVTLYLSLADALAISAGTWTIAPAQSLGVFVGGALPLEEFVFFLLTTVLVTIGLTLGIAEESFGRMRALIARDKGLLPSSSPSRAVSTSEEISR
jgi:lycopene cyclase domain-containing protein